jgi:hypothetical protein
VEYVMLAAFFDELQKVAAFPPPAGAIPEKPTEMKPPIAAPQIQPKAVNPSTKMGKSTNYTRSNVEAPGTDVGVGSELKSTPPPGQV